MGIGAHIDFAALAAEVVQIAPRPLSAQGGRLPFPSETMPRIFLQPQALGLSEARRNRGFLMPKMGQNSGNSSNQSNHRGQIAQ